MWPFTKGEKRETTSYTDAVTTALVNAATGGTAGKTTAAASAVLEAASGLIARCFLVADIQGGRGIVSQRMLADVARSLIRRGETVYVLRMAGDSFNLVPASSWDISGGVAQSSWRYNCELSAPNGSQSVSSPWSGVAHFQYATEPARPWAGLGPIQLGANTSVMLGNLEKSMGYEAGGTVGRILPIPADGEDSGIDGLRADLKALNGKTSLVEGGDWGLGGSGTNAPRYDWSSRRLGPEFTEAEVSAADQAARAVAGACGVPVELLFAGQGQSAQREGLRRLIHTTVAPLGQLMADELSVKLEQSVSISFDRVAAADLQGRARAWRSLVGKDAAIPDDEARRLAGLSEVSPST